MDSAVPVSIKYDFILSGSPITSPSRQSKAMHDARRRTISYGLVVGTNDFNSATRAGMNDQSEAVQLYDGSHEAETKAHARRTPDLVGPVETPQHRLSLLFADAATGVADAYDGFVVAA